MRGQIFINQCEVTVEVHTKLRNDLSSSKRKKGYNKPPFNSHNSNNNCNEHNGSQPNT